MALASTPPPTLDIPTQAHTLVQGDVVWRPHTVRPGETLSHLAVAHHTTVRAIAQHNRLDAGAFIVPGQKITVPVAKGSGRSKAAPGKAHRPTTTVRIRSGDTLSEIALRHDTTVSRLMKANRLTDPRDIHPGQKLVVPKAASTAARKKKEARPARVVARVTVRAGDTLSHIAVRHETTVSALMKANRLSSPRAIHPGQKLVITSTKASRDARTPKNTFAGRTYSDAVVGRAAKNRAILISRPVPSRSQVGAMIAETARRHGVDPQLAKAVAYQESGWNQRSVSVANAIGVMQVVPSTGEWIETLVGRELNLLDTRDNIEAGVVLLRTLDRSATSESEAIAGYYQGLAGVRQNGMYADTRQYVKNVLALKQRL